MKAVRDAKPVAGFCGHGRVGHRRRMRYQALDAAETFAQSAQFDALEHLSSIFERTRLKRYHPAKTRLLPLCQLMLGM